MKRWIFLILVAAGIAALALAGCAKPKPTLSVTLEQSGLDLVIHMETANFEIGKTGHAHVRLDGGPEVMPYTKTYTIPKVSPGKHSVWVELSDAKHQSLGISQTAEIEIK